MLTEIDRLLIEQACINQINRFARHNDQNNHQALVEMFTKDGIFTRPSRPGTPVVGRTAILEAFTTRSPRKSIHLVSNIVVEVLSATSAKATSHITLFAGPLSSGIAQKPYLIGHFHDEFSKVDGQWLFSSRIGGIDLKIE